MIDGLFGHRRRNERLLPNLDREGLASVPRGAWTPYARLSFRCTTSATPPTAPSPFWANPALVIFGALTVAVVIAVIVSLLKRVGIPTKYDPFLAPGTGRGAPVLEGSVGRGGSSRGLLPHWAVIFIPATAPVQAPVGSGRVS